MNPKTFPLHIVLMVLLVLIALGALFFMSKKSIVDNESQGATSTSTLETAATIVPASAAKEIVVKPGDATLSSKPVAATTSKASVPTPALQGSLCTANDLSGRASWVRSGSYLTGELVLKNSRADCVLPRASSVSIYAGNTLLADRQTSRPAADALLKSGEEKKVRFTWSNWCGQTVSRPEYVRFTLPGDLGYLRVPLIDANGRALYDAPVCAASGLQSTVDLAW